MDKKKRWIFFGIVGTVIVCGLLVLAVWLDNRTSKEILKLVDYKALDCKDRDPSTMSQQIIDTLVANTKFGKGLEKRTKLVYGDSLNYLMKEAEYLSLSLEAYAQKYYGGTEKELRAATWETAEEIAKEEAVLDMIAEKEKVVLTEELFEKMLPDYMESNGYTDRRKFLIDNNEAEVRASMRRELALQWIIDYLKKKEK